MTNGPRKLGKYELRQLLGRGGSAEVWKAFDTRLQRYVAIKLLHADLQNDPDFLKRFEREARVIASLHHPNIVKIHDFQISQNAGGAPDSSTTAYMVMEYVEGQTLNDYIRRTSRIGKFPTASEIIHLFESISSAIDYAHQRGMIHRDIKPANILLDQRALSRYALGEPILSDFGIVKLLGASTNTLSGGWLGTPLYISPEQAQGHPGNERSDIYSLSVILYEICTGVRPFQGDSPVLVIMQHIGTAPTSPDLINPRISPALTRVILRGLAKEPEARFASASSLLAALAEAIHMSTPRFVNPAPPASAIDAVSVPSDDKLSQPGLSVTKTPPSPLSHTFEAPSPPPAYSTTPATPHLMDAPSPWHNTPAPPDAPSAGTPGEVPTFPQAGISSPGNVGQPASGVAPSPVPTDFSPPPTSRSNKRRRNWFAALITLLILLLGSLGLGAFYFFTQGRPSDTATLNQIVGQAVFVSSGQVNDSSRGIADELQINLHNISPPESGRSYYAWLLSDKHPNQASNCSTPKANQAILLGKLTADHGNVNDLYPGDTVHTNLLGIASRFVVTEESATGTPRSPSNIWSYYAELPQTHNPNLPYSRGILDNLRCLLYRTGDLEMLGIHGGYEIHFLKNTQQLWKAAVNADSSRDPAFIRKQVVLILDYLDGSAKVAQDLPPGTHLPDVDPRSVQIPLLNFAQGQNFDSYMDHIDSQLKEILEGSDTSSDLYKLADQADTALLNNVNNWLEMVRGQARQLVKMSDAQLVEPTSLMILDSMETQANYAYYGEIDSSSGRAQIGILQIHQDIQHLTLFDVRPFPR